jgi:C1A family cysteine protease
MKAMALHGVPPESVWKYDPAKVNEEPPPFCYSYAQNYQALKYFRLDYAGISLEALLFQIKAVLSAGFPCMFGFTIYTSAYEDTNAKQGWTPFPDAKRDKVKGGHAVVAVGYDDYQLIPRADGTGYTLGAFLIRNCWGKAWGKGGYGWLPYEYVRRGLTYDWWSLLKAEWFAGDLIGAGASDLKGPKWPLQASLEGAFWIGGQGQSG